MIQYTLKPFWAALQSVSSKQWKTCKLAFQKRFTQYPQVNVIVHVHSDLMSICLLLLFRERDQLELTAGGSAHGFTGTFIWVSPVLLNNLKSKSLLPVQRLTCVSLVSSSDDSIQRCVFHLVFITVASYWLAVNSGSDSGRMSASWSHATEVVVNGSVFLSGKHCTLSMNNKIFVNHLCWLSYSVSNYF